MRMRTLLLAGLLIGCGDKDTDTTGDTGSTGGGDSGDTDTDVEPLSDYEGGQYRVSALVLVDDAAVGADLDGDGEVDNRLPGLLTLAATITGEPLDVDSLNKVLVEYIGKGELVLLEELSHSEDGTLTHDVLLGTVDKKGAVSVDASSYGGDGTPNSRFTGAFTSQTDYAVTADRVELPFPLVIGEPAVLVPLELAQNVGSVDGSSDAGIIAGAVPVDDVMAQVIEPLIPTGKDYDPELYLDMERDELIAFIYEFVTGKTGADITLGDGRAAVSAAVSYQASADSF